jgi:hypothetical protein
MAIISNQAYYPDAFRAIRINTLSNALSRTSVAAALARAYLMDLPQAGTIK